MSATNPTQSGIQYQAEPPEAVPQAARDALAAINAPGVQWSEHHGDLGVLVPVERWRDAIRALKEQGGYDWLVDHTAVDYPARTPRFTVVAILQDMDSQARLIVKTRAAEGEAVASLVPLWEAANWAERETYDLFGIPFEGHPNLTRIYMPQDYDGWPLRRDFPLAGHLRFRD